MPRACCFAPSHTPCIPLHAALFLTCASRLAVKDAANWRHRVMVMAPVQGSPCQVTRVTNTSVVSHITEGRAFMCGLKRHKTFRSRCCQGWGGWLCRFSWQALGTSCHVNALKVGLRGVVGDRVTANMYSRQGQCPRRGIGAGCSPGLNPRGHGASSDHCWCRGQGMWVAAWKALTHSSEHRTCQRNTRDPLFPQRSA